MNQYVCGHGHAYYDGDTGQGSPFEDGKHDAEWHPYDEDVESWEPWERAEYDRGYFDSTDVEP